MPKAQKFALPPQPVPTAWFKCQVKHDASKSGHVVHKDPLANLDGVSCIIRYSADMTVAYLAVWKGAENLRNLLAIEESEFLAATSSAKRK